MEQRVDFTYLRLITWAKAISAVVLSISVSAFIVSWGISLIWHYVPPELKIANPEIYLARIDPLKVVQETPFTVVQDKPFTFAPLDPIKVDISDIKVPALPATTAGGDVIRREVTAFSQVDHASGKVVTGWRYKDGVSREPFWQYCYYNAHNPNGTSTEVDIADNTVRRANILVAVPDLEGALAKCQWWRG
jgi:hypothetical protein